MARSSTSWYRRRIVGSNASGSTEARNPMSSRGADAEGGRPLPMAAIPVRHMNRAGRRQRDSQGDHESPRPAERGEHANQCAGSTHDASRDATCHSGQAIERAAGDGQIHLCLIAEGQPARVHGSAAVHDHVHNQTRGVWGAGCVERQSEGTPSRRAAQLHHRPLVAERPCEVLASAGEIAPHLEVASAFDALGAHLAAST